MSQKDPTGYVDESGAEHISRHNLVGAALMSSHKGSTAPTYAEAGTFWLDDSRSDGIWEWKFYDGVDWVTLAEIDEGASGSLTFTWVSDIDTSSAIIATLTVTTVNATTVNAGTVNTDTIEPENSSGGVSIDGFGFLNGSPNPSSVPAFRARTSNHNVLATAETKVQFDNEAFDTNGDYDSVTNYRFTPTRAGYYLIAVQMYWTGLNAGYVWGKVKMNGAGGIYDMYIIADDGNAERTGTAVGVFYFNGSTDYIEVFTQSESDSNYYVAAQSHFSGVRIA